MKMINFKLKIDNSIIKKYKKTKSGFLFSINGVDRNMRFISKNCLMVIGCEKCNCETKLKNLQQLISLNKPYLCRSCRSFGVNNGMYNKKHKPETILKLIKINSGENNHFYGKKHSDLSKYKQSQSKVGMYSGKNNPMYGKSVLDIWIKKYGIDDALKRFEKMVEKQKLMSSGEKNSMYGKSVLDIWVEKYGIEEANNLYDKWILNIKSSLNSLYQGENGNIIKEKISKSLKNRLVTDEHRKNLRISQLNYISKKLKLNGNKMVPHFNIYACGLFDKISELKNVNIQHALNGGEFYIKDLGYWVDGYDEKNNVVYEYYEHEHNKKIERDLIRENEIKLHLNCDFKIIKEGFEDEFLKNII